MKTIVFVILFFTCYSAFSATSDIKIACRSDLALFAEKIESNPQILDMRDEYNSNILHVAAICQNSEVFEYISKLKPEYRNQLNSWGDSPLTYQHSILVKKPYFSFTRNSKFEPAIQGAIAGAGTGVSATLLSMALVRSVKLVFSGLRAIDPVVMSDLAGISLFAIIGGVAGSYLFHHNDITFDNFQSQQRLIYLSSLFD